MHQTRYFAMLDSQCKGPFTLEELYEAGVTPDTYVWSKKMTDWEMARDVDEIRNFTRTLLERKHYEAEQSVKKQNEEKRKDQNKSRFIQFNMEFPMVEDQVDINTPPASMIIPSILATLMCFPITGLVALLYGIKSKKEWAEALRGDNPSNSQLYSEKEKTQCKERAHHYARQARMWLGIYFFMGIILYSTVIFR